MVLRASSLLKLLPLLCFTAALSSAQSIPAIKAKALDNSEIVLPDPGSRQFLILILGFSQKGGKLCQVWSKKISADYHADTRIAYFSLPVLQSAPSLVRPIIVYGMRKVSQPRSSVISYRSIPTNLIGRNWSISPRPMMPT